MSNQEYRIGVIGIGGRGMGLAKYCARLPNAKLVAVADMRPERLDKAVQEFGNIARYDHHKAMLAKEPLDMVVIGTWGMHHKEPTVDAANAGVKGIYVEKPMASSLAECDAMIAACRANNTKLSIGHQRRWWPEYKAARDAIRRGDIGKPTHGSMHWSTGRVSSMGTHLFDALNIVVDDEVAWVSGRLDPTSKPWPQWPDVLDPGAMGYMVYRNGVRIAVDVMDDVRQPIDMFLYGTRGRLHILRDGFDIHYWARDEEPAGMYDGFKPLTERAFPPTPYPTDLNAHGTIEGLTELVDCIAHNREPSSTGAHGRHAVEIIVAFHLSSKNNMQPVQLPLTGDAAEFSAAAR